MPICARNLLGSCANILFHSGLHLRVVDGRAGGIDGPRTSSLLDHLDAEVMVVWRSLCESHLPVGGYQIQQALVSTP